MTQRRHKIKFTPYLRNTFDNTFDIPADAPPIAAVTFGPVEGVSSHIPVMVWIPFVVSEYDHG